MKSRSRGLAGTVLFLGAVLLPHGGAGAAEVFCVDAVERPGKSSEWSLAEHVGETVWTQQGSDALLLFVHRPTPDAKMLWPSGVELGLFWPIPDHLRDGVPDATLDELKKLQFVVVTLVPATEEETAIFRFDRTAVKLTDAGEFRKELNQTWRYELRPTDDCLKLTGHITMLRYGESESGLRMPATLTRSE